ncbi:C-GCAxxG-C-C family protein [Sphaerochaeta globosa]|uniref:C_GCAxxG_C_C family protein n=1 Tax=Sphaerochaeta globosa (strain ATCC BAA-1886 / DSM 22777 / Buddy) TaxID=158189 RepID=F0RSS6_SPHGB|nr:C-GCAxxG-C-C family protein [Sphaerochaeta globosa]ADY13976.1 C_GCAxxG_C_C family protein [Sphaerochaeta globosa str. Buddy]
MEQDYVNKAMELRSKGYNCAQSVACVFADEVGMSEQTLFSLMEGFGGGMGAHQGTCGAVSGAVAIVSMVTSKGSVQGGTKSLTYARTAAIVSEFFQKNGSSVCKEILGDETGVVLRSCDGCVEDSVRMVHKLLQKVKEADR